MNVVANHIIRQEDVVEKKDFEQLDLFTDYGELEKQKQERKKEQ
jgi:DNA polymerase V